MRESESEKERKKIAKIKFTFSKIKNATNGDKKKLAKCVIN